MKLVAIVFMISASLAAAGESEKFILREVQRGNSVNLQEYGGPHIHVAVRNREMTYLVAGVADYTDLTPVARTKINGVTVDNDQGTATVFSTSRVVMQPAGIIRRIEKSGGAHFPGSSSEMYLLYRDLASGVGVYFLDTISSQNCDTLVISVPLTQPKPPSVLITPTSPESARQPGNEQANRNENGRREVSFHQAISSGANVAVAWNRWREQLVAARTRLASEKEIRDFNAESARLHALRPSTPEF